MKINVELEFNKTWEFNGQYCRALLGTLFMVALIVLGSSLVVMQERFASMWFLGAIYIICTFVIMLYINYKFIVFTEDEVSQDE